MRSESEKTKLLVFMGTLTVLAFVINVTVAFKLRGSSRSAPTYAPHSPSVSFERPVSRPSQSQPETSSRMVEEDRAAQAKRAAQAAAEEHARFLSRYLNGSVSRKPGMAAIALVAATESKRSNRAISDAVAQRLSSKSVAFLPTFFKPEFVSDGLFNEAFNEPSDLPKKLELANALDGILIARQSVEYSKNPELENVITASMRLDVLALPIAGGAQRQTWTFTAYGAGFKEIDARKLAEERLIKQITNDTKMSLAPFSLSNPNQ